MDIDKMFGSEKFKNQITAAGTPGEWVLDVGYSISAQSLQEFYYYYL
jgi:hypothetical protein